MPIYSHDVTLSRADDDATHYRSPFMVYYSHIMHHFSSRVRRPRDYIYIDLPLTDAGLRYASFYPQGYRRQRRQGRSASRLAAMRNNVRRMIAIAKVTLAWCCWGKASRDGKSKPKLSHASHQYDGWGADGRYAFTFRLLFKLDIGYLRWLIYDGAFMAATPNNNDITGLIIIFLPASYRTYISPSMPYTIACYITQSLRPKRNYSLLLLADARTLIDGRDSFWAVDIKKFSIGFSHYAWYYIHDRVCVTGRHTMGRWVWAVTALRALFITMEHWNIYSKLMMRCIDTRWFTGLCKDDKNNARWQAHRKFQAFHFHTRFWWYMPTHWCNAPQPLLESGKNSN